MTADLARYSDLSFHTASGVYVLAVLLLACELASTSTRAVARRDEARELVGVGADAPARPTLPGAHRRTGGTSAGGPAGADGHRTGGAWGLVLHVVSIVLRGISAGRAPWGNMYEFTSLVTAVAVAGTLLVMRRHTVRPLSVFVLLPVIVLMFIGGTLLYARSAPVVPALQSYWLVIHVSIIATASGVLLVSGVASLLFLVRRRHPEGPLVSRLPGAQTLDRVAYRTAIFAFPAVHRRSHPGRDLGGGRLGALLGLGPQGDHRLRHLGAVRGVPARAGDGRLAQHPGRVDQRGRHRGGPVQPLLHQHRDLRVALLRGAQLTGVAGGVSSG